MQGLLGQIAAQREAAFLWAPVALVVGISGYFGLRFEPAVLIHVACLTGALFVLSLYLVWPHRVGVLVLGAAIIAGGFGLAGLRAHMVAEPVLEFRYYGPIEGRIVRIDRSQSQAVRLTLDRVVLHRMDPRRTPEKVRVSLHAAQEFITPKSGQTVILTGYLSPPAGPVEPRGYDFRRMAWFQGLGAVGYTRTPVVLARPAHSGAAGLWIYRLRMAISQGVQARMDRETGAFATAILTGDRSAMEPADLAVLRASNLAHLLAISGMHMGLLAAFVFATVRNGLAIWPWAALRVPTKKIAALTALVAASCYLALSGGQIATERAFIMVGVMLVAVLFDRRALSLRAVAAAAVIVLVLRPEAVSGPGFQMSFAATTALVAVFGALRQLEFDRGPKWLRPVFEVVICSFVAGLATAPIAAFHFNQIAHYGLLANVVSVPLMGTLVMPAAVLAAVLTPLGMEGIGLWFMELGLSWIIGVARFVAGLDGSLRHVVTPAPQVLVLICAGVLWVILWRGSWRWAGMFCALLGFALWPMTDRPDLLVADSGSLIGVMTPDGRDLSKARGDSFASVAWLENDGAPVAQNVAFAREKLIEEGRMVRVTLGDTRVINVRGKTALAALSGCGGADLVITNQRMEDVAGCEVFDVGRLRQTGAVAGWVVDGQLHLETVRDHTGDRLWTDHNVRRR